MTGTDIRRRRIRLGLSRAQLAHQLGISAEALEQWEGGASAISCPRALSQILREEEDVERATDGRHHGERWTA